MTRKFHLITFLFILFVSFALETNAQLLLEAEGEIVTSGYNKIRIPGDEGTLFDANKEFNFDPQFAYRFRAGYRFNDKHNVFVLFAPLKVEYTGSFDEPVNYYNQSFNPNQPSEIVYVFNSYRLTYRYDFVSNDKLRLGVGLTGKIRDAYIEVNQGGKSAKKTNVGVVPLINILAHYRITSNVGITLEGDWLTSNNGRAFDLQLAVPVFITENFGVKAGYRVLEGGADNDEVYNFTWINYYQLGAFYNFY